MKKSFLILGLFVAQINFAQNTFPIVGNVGIGIENPTQKLDVNGNAIFRGAIISSSSDDSGGVIQLRNPSKISNGIASTWMIYNMTGSYGNSLQFWAYDNLGCAGGGMCNNRLTIMDNGNVGIGINTPVSKLSLAGSLTINGGLTNTLSRPIISAGTLTNGEIRGYSNGGNNYDDGFLRLSAGGGTSSTVKSYIDLSGYSTVPEINGNIVFGTYGAERMRIDRNGYIGIGTSGPDEKLTVKGKIHTQEVRVDMSGALVPDYVFSNDYKLRTLKEVETYVNQNSHLPEIPSAKEFEKNGIQLAEMNMALLKKVEELTLYAIEQQKNTEKLTKIIEEQNKRLEILEIKKSK